MTNNKLFDNEDEEPREEEDFTEGFQIQETEEEDEEYIPKPSHDKIFGNDYNTGNLDFEEYTLPKVDSFYAEDNLRECYDSYEYNRKKVLEEKVDLFFLESEAGKVLGNKKKLPKQVLPQVYVAIREKFTGNDYTGSEIFIAIAEYFSINYEVLYENIPSLYREELVRELDDKYGVLKKRGVKRLF
jgi:hypothetical protein